MGKHFRKILSFLFVCFKWLRIEETIHPQRPADWKSWILQGSNSQKLEANTAGISKKNKRKVFIVANGAFEQTSSNTMSKTLLRDFYDSSQQHPTKHTWAVINFLQPYINITGILSSVIFLALKAAINKSVTTLLLLSPISLSQVAAFISFKLLV